MQWPILAGLTPEARDALLDVARRRSFGRNEVVFHRGDPADTMHLIRTGRFAVRVTTSFGDTATLSVIGPGDAFGQLALIEEGPRTATVMALEPASTLSVHTIDFQRLRATEPPLSEVMVRALATRVHELTDLLVEALYLPAETRVLRRLRELADTYAADGEIVVPLTQEELAELAGTSRATVNKVLREAEDSGTVQLRRGRVVVTRPEDLPSGEP